LFLLFSLFCHSASCTSHRQRMLDYSCPFCVEVVNPSRHALILLYFIWYALTYISIVVYQMHRLSPFLTCPRNILHMESEFVRDFTIEINRDTYTYLYVLRGATINNHLCITRDTRRRKLRAQRGLTSGVRFLRVDLRRRHWRSARSPFFLYVYKRVHIHEYTVLYGPPLPIYANHHPDEVGEEGRGLPPNHQLCR